MNEGKSIDSDIVLKLLIDVIDRQKEKHIVMDGFPMNEKIYGLENEIRGEKLHSILIVKL